ASGSADRSEASLARAATKDRRARGDGVACRLDADAVCQLRLPALPHSGARRLLGAARSARVAYGAADRRQLLLLYGVVAPAGRRAADALVLRGAARVLDA